MRTRYLATAALLAGSLQTSQAQRLEVGLKLGASALNVAGASPDFLPTHWIGGVAGGLVLRAPVGHRQGWAVQAEALYTQLGYRYDFSNGGYTPFQVTRLHCLALPVLAQWHWHRLVVEAGPQVGWVLSATDNIDTGPYPTTDNVRRFTAGYAAGVGTQLGTRVVVGARFQQNLTRLYKYVEADPLNNARAYAVQLQGTWYLSSRPAGTAR